jgi:pimeloyl-ACP methyl ester carboxylesterase
MTPLLLSLALALAPAPQETPPQEGSAETPPASGLAPETLTRTLPDGLEMTADYYAQRGRLPGPIVVACHMAGSSRGEFVEIAPEFSRYGCSLLAVDLRAGKEHGGVANQTAAAFEKKHGRAATYEEAYPDVVEAVKWARELRPEAKLILLGSSYSAALAIAFAGREPKAVDAVLAFSPGEYIEGWTVALDARKVAVPVHVSCGNGPEEKGKAMRLYNALDKKLRSSYFPADSIVARHGAPLLIQPDEGARNRVWHGVYMLIKSLSEPTPPASAGEGK